MDIALFLFGSFGALVVVYLAKQEVVPEFRPLLDAATIQQSMNDCSQRIQKIEGDIDAVATELREPSLTADRANGLRTVLEQAQAELQAQQAREQALRRELAQNQVASRGLGFLAFILLGGVFGSLLAGRVKVQVEGLGGELPTYVQSFIIGATWTTYLTIVGIRNAQQKAQETIPALRREISTELGALTFRLAHASAAQDVNGSGTPKLAAQAPLRAVHAGASPPATNGASDRELLKPARGDGLVPTSVRQIESTRNWLEQKLGRARQSLEGS